MRSDFSIRTRLVLGAALVLVAFMAVAGGAVQRAHADSVRAAHFVRLQGTIYLLLAGAELDAGGALVMPASLAEPRLSLPGSGLYASILNVNRREAWQSASAVGISPPFQRSLPVGEWRNDTVAGAGGVFLAVDLCRQVGRRRGRGAAGAVGARKQVRIRSRTPGVRADDVGLARRRGPVAAALADLAAAMGPGALAARGRMRFRASRTASKPRCKGATRRRSRRSPATSTP